MTSIRNAMLGQASGRVGFFYGFGGCGPRYSSIRRRRRESLSRDQDKDPAGGWNRRELREVSSRIGN
jgi:GH43 family beta-xylosidase